MKGQITNIIFINKNDLATRPLDSYMADDETIKEYHFTDEGVYLVLTASNLAPGTVDVSLDETPVKNNMATKKQVNYVLKLQQLTQAPGYDYTRQQLEQMNKIEVGQIIRKLKALDDEQNGKTPAPKVDKHMFDEPKKKKDILDNPATRAQKNFIEKLIKNGTIDSVDVDTLTKRQAGDIIKGASLG